jgi:alpha-ketoglutarate-dependent taurine dioxygenase
VTQAESEAILAQLYAHTLQDRWRYSHQWQVGDLLVWDNPSLLHRGEPVPVDQYRLVHRSTVTYRNTHL